MIIHFISSILSIYSLYFLKELLTCVLHDFQCTTLTTNNLLYNSRCKTPNCSISKKNFNIKLLRNLIVLPPRDNIKDLLLITN